MYFWSKEKKKKRKKSSQGQPPRYSEHLNEARIESNVAATYDEVELQHKTRMTTGRQGSNMHGRCVICSLHNLNIVLISSEIRH